MSVYSHTNILDIVRGLWISAHKNLISHHIFFLLLKFHQKKKDIFC